MWIYSYERQCCAMLCCASQAYAQTRVRTLFLLALNIEIKQKIYADTYWMLSKWMWKIFGCCLPFFVCRATFATFLLGSSCFVFRREKKTAYLLDAMRLDVFAPIQFGILKLTAFDIDEYLRKHKLSLNTFLQCLQCRNMHVPMCRCVYEKNSYIQASNQWSIDKHFS